MCRTSHNYFAVLSTHPGTGCTPALMQWHFEIFQQLWQNHWWWWIG